MLTNLIRTRKARAAAVLATVALAAGVAAGPAAAQADHNQAGLVVVNVDNVLNNNDVTVQVPISVAANICDVDVQVLVADLADDGSATCTADANSNANNPRN